MSNPSFDELNIGDVFYITEPYRQYYVKLAPFVDDAGRECNAEELESGRPLYWRDSPRFSIHRDDGGRSWKGPTRRKTK